MTLSAAGAGKLNFSATRANGKVSFSASIFSRSESHNIAVRAPAGSFTNSPSLSEAQVTGVGPFLAGKAKFAASPESSCPPQNASGPITGDLAIKFDSVGTKRPFVGAQVIGPLFQMGVTCTSQGPGGPGSNSPPEDEPPPDTGPPEESDPGAF